MTGTLILPYNTPAIKFRTGSAYDDGIGHDTAAGESMAFMQKSSLSTFKFKVGYDPANFGSNTFVPMTNADLEIGAGYGKIAGYKIWHAGNVGSGSGLDADMLDGQSGAYYRINIYNAAGTLLN